MLKMDSGAGCIRFRPDGLARRDIETFQWGEKPLQKKINSGSSTDVSIS